MFRSRASRCARRLLVGAACVTLSTVAVAPAEPAGAQVYGRYQLRSTGSNMCLTVPRNGGTGTFVEYASCGSGANPV